MPIHAKFFQRAILTHKVGHTDLVFGVQSGFISSLCMQDYKSLCSGYDLYYPGSHPDTEIQTAYMKISAV